MPFLLCRQKFSASWKTGLFAVFADSPGSTKTRTTSQPFFSQCSRHSFSWVGKLRLPTCSVLLTRLYMTARSMSTKLFLHGAGCFLLRQQNRRCRPSQFRVGGHRNFVATQRQQL